MSGRGLLRRNERVISFPMMRPAGIDLSPVPGNVAPGQFLAQMDPPMIRMPNGLILQSLGDGFTKGSHAEEMRADCATVRRLGPIPPPDHPAFESAMSMHRQIGVGDRVLLTPYVNRFKELAGIRDAHIGGLDGDEWLDTTIAKEIPGGWQLLGNWVMVRLAYRYKPIPEVVKRRAGAGANTIYNKQLPREFLDHGIVEGRGRDADCEPGEDILIIGREDIRPYDCKYFVAPRGPYGDDVVFFREASYQVAQQLGELEWAYRVAAVKPEPDT